jgi:transcriptional regulator GlxA family with amidase domain
MEALLSTTLLAHHAQRASEGDSTHATQTQIKAAIAYIDEHADQAIGPREMAAAAHMSVRAFQYNLRKYTGKTPSDLLREVRLERAHRDLVAGDPAVDTVAGIAHRWGFGNLGRFSHRYSERFGELPSETLRS